MGLQSMIPSIDTNKSYREKRIRTRPDRKMRVRLYMSTKEKETWKNKSEKLGFTMTTYVSYQVKQVSEFLHREEIEVQEIDSKEDYIHLKLSVTEHYHLKKYSQLHKISIEQAATSWFSYSQIPRRKQKSDERKFIEMNENKKEEKRTVIINRYSDSETGLKMF